MMAGMSLAWCLVAASLLGEAPVRPDLPNTIEFPAREAKFVRFVIHKTSSSQPCVDELEVFGPEEPKNLALCEHGAKATASSCLSGYAKHQIAHLNDGRYGNEASWIAAGTGTEWAQIELREPASVAKVVFSRDRNRQYADRIPIHFEVQLSGDGRAWTSVREVSTRAMPVAVGRGTGLFGGIVPPPPAPPRVSADGSLVFGAASIDRQAPASNALLRDAFVAEEHALLKTHGRADLDRRLTETAYRQKKHPAHVGDDRLPCAPLANMPTLDGRLDDRCWEAASRGVVRVADPTDFDRGPLVVHTVRAGLMEEDLFLAIETDRLLSSHLAVVSSADGQGCGVLTLTKKGAVFNCYEPKGRAAKLGESRPVDAAFDPTLTRFEVRLPVAWFGDCRERGIRVGLGIGGRHTIPEGRPVNLLFAPFSVAQVGPCAAGTFRVRVSAASGGDSVRLHGNLPGLVDGLVLGAGESRVLEVPAFEGPIGPQFDLSLDDASGNAFLVHLFRYDPLALPLRQMGTLIDRLAAKGLDVGTERAQWAALCDRRERLLAGEPADRVAERAALFDVRLAKRHLLFRDPDLAPLADVLFVKRHAFEPSHNYSVLLDSKYRGGGGVFTLHLPRREGRLDPERAAITKLFEAEGGIARTPMANFDRSQIYFGYRPAQDGYFHLMRMAPDGSGLKQLTSGPFHDYWPCPLPDGGLAFISTRCRARFLCWRPQAAVLFRMDADGRNVRPLSFANLTEWGPSVMSDGRIIWQRSEYIDKGADYSHTLWSIRPDGSKPELVFGNTILLPQGYANGREVPGTHEICCTMISHFGDLNGPIALLDLDRGRFNPEAIRSITPEVPWPGAWPREECFRDPVPVSRDYFLVSHAPRDRFGLFVIDRYGNREILHLDGTYSSVCPTLYRPVQTPPVLTSLADQTAGEEQGELFLADVYRGLEGFVPRGKIKHLRVVEEVRADLIELPDGSYQRDHSPFMHWYATPVDKIRGPFGWPSYVAKATWGLVPVEEDGSASFRAPAGKQLYFQALDEEYNEIQRMRSVVQLQPGERRSCIGCHEDRRRAPPAGAPLASMRPPSTIEPPPWGAGPFAYEEVVQPILTAKCAGCHDSDDEGKIDLTGLHDADRIPASYKTLVLKGWVHHLDLGYKSGENLKVEPGSFGTLKSKLFGVLEPGHHDVELARDEVRALKCWIDLNCPLWPDYQERSKRPTNQEDLVLQVPGKGG